MGTFILPRLRREKTSLRRAISRNAPRQRWHSWQPRQCVLCNLPTGKARQRNDPTSRPNFQRLDCDWLCRGSAVGRGFPSCSNCRPGTGSKKEKPPGRPEAFPSHRLLMAGHWPPVMQSIYSQSPSSENRVSGLRGFSLSGRRPVLCGTCSSPAGHFFLRATFYSTAPKHPWRPKRVQSMGRNDSFNKINHLRNHLPPSFF